MQGPLCKFSQSRTKKHKQACSSCPTDTGSAFGSTDMTACKCNAGSTGPDGGDCVACESGSYKAVGNAACRLCPSNSSSEAGSDRLVNCSCIRGFTGPNGASCLPCAAGSYKNTTGNATCSDCASGTYTSMATSLACTHCPSHAISPRGSIVPTDCVCNEGYSGPNGGVCTACAQGKFKHSLGNSSCIYCPSGSTSEQGSDNVTDCECAAGYTGPDGVSCVVCRAGTFKLDTGDAACAECRPGTFKNVSGPGECSPCASGSSSPAGSNSSTACTCQPGFAGGSPPCTACDVGKYQNDSGVCVPCNTTLCGTGKYRESCETVARSLDATCYNCSAVKNAFFTSDGGFSDKCSWQCAKDHQQDCRTNACEICTADKLYQRMREAAKSTFVASCVTCPKDAECDGSEMVVCKETYYLATEEIRSIRNMTTFIQNAQTCRECPEGALICPNRGCFFPRQTNTKSGCDVSINMTVSPPIGKWEQDLSTGVWGLLDCPPGYEMISLYSKPEASSAKAQRCQKCVPGLQV